MRARRIQYVLIFLSLFNFPFLYAIQELNKMKAFEGYNAEKSVLGFAFHKSILKVLRLVFNEIPSLYCLKFRSVKEFFNLLCCYETP